MTRVRSQNRARFTGGNMAYAQLNIRYILGREDTFPAANFILKAKGGTPLRGWREPQSTTALSSVNPRGRVA